MSNVTLLRSGDPMPPVNYEAEMAFLSALLTDNRVMDAAGHLKPEHFADDRHGRIFDAARKLIESGSKADAIRLAAHLEADLEELGGREYLARIAAYPVSTSNAKGWADHIIELATRRALMDLASSIRGDAVDLDNEVPGIVGRFSDSIDRIMQDGAAPTQARGVGEIAKDVLSAIDARRHREGLLGVPTGLRDLDDLMCGLQRDHLTILAGRPGMGKSTLARHIAINAGLKGHAVAVFSLEMSSDEWVTQHLADMSDMDIQDMRRGRVNDIERVAASARESWGLPVYIDDQPGQTVAQMQVIARGMIRKHNVGLVIVDHLGIVKPERPDSRYHEITQISRDLKRMAKALGVPVVALCQLSRAVEQRDDKRPTLADLRDSGSIEQDADNVLFVYRHRYYEPSPPDKRKGESVEDYQERFAHWNDTENVAEVIVAKQRMGPLGSVRVYYDGSRARFRDLARAA